MLTVGALCSGLGGIEIGLEATGGFRTLWHSEIDRFCNAVLAYRFPQVPNVGNLCHLEWERLPRPDVITAGFPCQPSSLAGKRKGTADERWIWPDIFRGIVLLRPRYCVLENVPGLLTVNGGRAFGEVVGDLASIGYDTEWQVFSAADVGAPHLRRRLWIIVWDRGLADAEHGRREQRDPRERGVPEPDARGDVPDADQGGRQRGGAARRRQSGSADGAALQHADGQRREERQPAASDPASGHAGGRHGAAVGDARGEQGRLYQQGAEAAGAGAGLVDAARERRGEGQPEPELRRRWPTPAQPSSRVFLPIRRSTFWDNWVVVAQSTLRRTADGLQTRLVYRRVHPDIPAVAAGVKGRVAMLRALGNAVVPQCAEYVGHSLLALHERLTGERLC